MTAKREHGVAMEDVETHFSPPADGVPSHATKVDAKASESGVPEEDGAYLKRTGVIGGGVVADVRRRLPWYRSDWTDAFKPENRGKASASVVFLFFACLAPAVTFGMLFDDYTDGQLGVVEMIISSGISGIVYSVLSGQPLCVLGATGPELAYTVVFYNLCDSWGLEFLPARVWQGLWTALFTILMALFDTCSLMSHVSRFTEEIFSALISIIFIFEAIYNVGKMFKEDDLDSRASAFLGAWLAFGAYGLAMWFRAKRGSTLFNRPVREVLANYAVSIAILVFAGIAAAFDGTVGVEKLAVPSSLRPTLTDSETGEARDWFVNPAGVHKDFPVWGVFATALPALGLAFLGYMDQNLTSLLINRKAHKLEKPPAYHLDLLVCGVFVYPICAFLGLPFTHAATVRSMTHLNSLTTRETVELPGGGSTTRVASVIEQRVTHFAIHVLLLLSLVLAPALQQVPKAVLYGVFLYMGVTSIPGNELFDRLFLWTVWTPEAYPKFDFVTKVSSIKALHSFTAFQFLMLVVLYVLTKIQAVSFVFPFFIGLLVPIRWGMNKYWQASDLAVLDS